MYVDGSNRRQYVSLWKVLYLQSEWYDKLLAWLALQIAILSWYQHCQTAHADSNVWQYLNLSLLMETLELASIWHRTKSRILAMISAAYLPPIAHVFSGPTLGRSTSNSSWGAAREPLQGGWRPSLSFSMLLTEEGVCFSQYLSKTLGLNFITALQSRATSRWGCVLTTKQEWIGFMIYMMRCVGLRTIPYSCHKYYKYVQAPWSIMGRGAALLSRRSLNI